MNRNAEISIMDELGRERERFKVNYGAQITVEEGAEVAAGTILADWDAYTIPIVAEVGGTIKYGDIFEGITMQEKVDVVTGKSSMVIIHSAGSSQLNPRISVRVIRERPSNFLIPRPMRVTVFLSDRSYRSTRVT